MIPPKPLDRAIYNIKYRLGKYRKNGFDSPPQSKSMQRFFQNPLPRNPYVINEQPLTCGQHVYFLKFFSFLYRKYRYRSVAIQIPHDVGLVPISYIGRKIPLRGSKQCGIRSMNSKHHDVNHVMAGTSQQSTKGVK